MPDITIAVKGVKKILKGLNPSKAKGPDSIHPRVLKELAAELAPTLAFFFQQSVDNGIIPADWKRAVHYIRRMIDPYLATIAQSPLHASSARF